MEMSKTKKIVINIVLVVVGLGLVFELIRDSMRDGDFVGYVNAGILAMEGKNLYSDVLNTWPPFFSVFSIFLAVGDALSSVMIRFLW